jgi:hypothetical protein
MPSEDPSIIRHRGARRLVEFVASKPFGDLSSASSRRDVLRSADAQWARQFVLTVNALLRDVDSATHTFDGRSTDVHLTVGGRSAGVVMTGLSNEDSIAALEKASKAVQVIAVNPDLSDEEAVRYAGLAMAGSMNLAHNLFRDGHGRAGRAVSYLLTRGFDGTRAARVGIHLVSVSRDAWRIDPSGLNDCLAVAVRHETTGVVALRPDEPSFTDIATQGDADEQQLVGAQLQDSQVAPVLHAVNDREYGALALFETMTRRGLDMDLFLKRFPVNPPWIRLASSLRALGNKGVVEFVECHRQLRVRHVDIFLEEIANPRRWFQVPEGGTCTLRERYDEQLSRSSVDEGVRRVVDETRSPAGSSPADVR